MQNPGIRPNLNKQQIESLQKLERAQIAQQADDRERKRQYNLTKATAATLTDLTRDKKPLNALARALYTGVKLAEESKNPFFDPLVNPLRLVSELRKLGPEALVWSPETLCSVIDSRHGGWTRDRVLKSLEHFHSTGELDTAVPELVRQKLYALRLVITSDSPHNFWENFEKVGCVFNDRLADFSVVQALSAAECAKTLAVIQNIRPDQYSREVRIYVAACCHQDGLYTTAPSKWLGAFNQELQDFNEGTGTREDPATRDEIGRLYSSYKKSPPSGHEDSTESIQAVKLLGIDAYATEALIGQN